MSDTITTLKKKKWHKLFLDALSKVPNVSYAAKVAQIERSHVYREKQWNPEFAKEFDEALAAGKDLYFASSLSVSNNDSTVRMWFLNHFAYRQEAHEIDMKLKQVALEKAKLELESLRKMQDGNKEDIEVVIT